jgi:putative sigma-54 modulation protein
MSQANTPIPAGDRVIVRGIHLDLTPALRAAAADKAERLLRHEEHIVRLRLDLEADQTHGVTARYIAKGRVEIRGPDLIASVSSEDAYKSLDLLIDKLDELLRRRHQKRVNTRNDERRQPEPDADE